MGPLKPRYENELITSRCCWTVTVDPKADTVNLNDTSSYFPFYFPATESDVRVFVYLFLIKYIFSPFNNFLNYPKFRLILDLCMDFFICIPLCPKCINVSMYNPLLKIELSRSGLLSSNSHIHIYISAITTLFSISTYLINMERRISFRASSSESNVILKYGF